MAVSSINPKQVNARSLGFGLGPRMNAAGRLETAEKSLELLLETDPMEALQKAQYLDVLNLERRNDQNKIFKEACLQADKYRKDPVLVLSSTGWSHGIVGIVASKILEKYKKPVFVLEELGEIIKGSARSYGDFSVVEAINENLHLLNSGGGHKLAAGITLATSNIDEFRQKINEFYARKNLSDQQKLLLPKEDAIAELNELTEELVSQIDQLEPFGNGNPRPIIKSDSLLVKNVRSMGSDGQHVKLELVDKSGIKIDMLAFNAPEFFKVEIGKKLDVWYHVNINEWQGRRSIEGQLLHIKLLE
jgi:single-stranded-DNA-specific exonuclease